MTTTTISPTIRLQRSDNVIAVDMEDETVMMDIVSGNYFALTGSGSNIWAALEKPITIGQVIERVQQEFDMPELTTVLKAENGAEVHPTCLSKMLRAAGLR